MSKKAIIKRQFEELAARIVALPTNGPLMVGIDGVTASGKTTLADTLAPLIKTLGRPVVRATIDGFHNPPDVRYRKGKDSPEGYYADSFNYDALINTLLEPLSQLSSVGMDLAIAAYDHRLDVAVKNQRAQI